MTSLYFGLILLIVFCLVSFFIVSVKFWSTKSSVNLNEYECDDGCDDECCLIDEVDDIDIEGMSQNMWDDLDHYDRISSGNFEVGDCFVEDASFFGDCSLVRIITKVQGGNVTYEYWNGIEGCESYYCETGEDFGKHELVSMFVLGKMQHVGKFES